MNKYYCLIKILSDTDGTNVMIRVKAESISWDRDSQLCKLKNENGDIVAEMYQISDWWLELHSEHDDQPSTIIWES